MPLQGDEWVPKNKGPFRSTGQIPGKTGSTVYDKDGFEWVRDTNKDPSWSCPFLGIAGDDGNTHRHGPFTVELPLTNYLEEYKMATGLKSKRAGLVADIEASERAIAAATAAIDEAKAALKGLTPDEPAGADAVVRFRKYNGRYSYAAIKTVEGPLEQARWFVTQDGTRSARQGIPPKTWPELLEWIGERNWDAIRVLS